MVVVIRIEHHYRIVKLTVGFQPSEKLTDESIRLIGVTQSIYILVLRVLGKLRLQHFVVQLRFLGVRIKGAVTGKCYDKAHKLTLIGHYHIVCTHKGSVKVKVFKPHIVAAVILGVAPVCVGVGSVVQASVGTVEAFGAVSRICKQMRHGIGIAVFGENGDS